MKKYLLILITSVFTFSSCDTAKLLLGEPSEAETLAALTKILDSSALRTVTTLSDVSQNGLAGLLPEEIRPVLNTLKSVGIGEDVDKIEATIGNIAASVTSESGEILKEAVREISFGDAVSIVLGGENAATNVLKDAMYTTVKRRYSEKLTTKLNAEAPEITRYWNLASGAYNLFAKDKVSDNISDFVAERAVDAMFSGMGKEEAKIRDNIPGFGDSTVSKVFDFYRSQRDLGLR